MALDNAKNFAKVTVSTGYDASATSVVLTTGHGAKLPTAPFNAVWWNASDYGDPSDDPNVEIVRITVKSTDTLTITRAQESTSASTKNTSGKTYKMIAGLTAKVINTDIGSTVSGTSVGPATSTTQTITHGLGKTPVTIRLSGITYDAGAGVIIPSNGIYDNASQNCIYPTYSVGVYNGVTSSSSYAIYLHTSTSGVATGVVGNLTSTTFDIVWTTNADFSVKGVFLWEAQ